MNTWGHIDLKYTPSDNSIFNILRRYYPNFDLLKETYDFKKLCNISNEQYMNIDYLDKSHFKFEDNKAIIFNLGMGSGKTAQTINYLKEQININTSNNILWLAPNVALAEGTHKRPIDNNIKITLYNKVKKASEKAEILDNAENLVLCLNSLHYVNTNSFKIVVIDEIETFLKNWVFNDTLKDVKNNCYENFIRLLKGADKIILLDAFITNITIDFLKDLNIQYKIVKKKYIVDIATERTAIKYNSYYNLLNNLINNIKRGKKCLIFYPFKTTSSYFQSMEDILKILNTKQERKE